MSTVHHSPGRRTNVADDITDDELSRRIDELRGFSRLTQRQSDELRLYEHHLIERDRARRDEALARQLGTTPDRLRSGELLRPGDLDLNPGALERAVPSDTPTDTSPGARTRDIARRTVDLAHRSGRLSDDAAGIVEGLLSRGNPAEQSATARWVNATGDPAYLRAFGHLLADPIRGHMMFGPEELAAFQRVQRYDAEQRAMSLTDANGGFLVPMTLDPAINLTSAGSTNPLRQVARVVQTATDAWTGITSAGATAEWKAEAAEAADGSPTVDDQPIPVHFGDAYVPYSFEVGMDAANFAIELAKVLADAADQLQNTAYTTGSGSGQPTGFITALAGGSSIVTPAVAEGLTAADAYALQNALPPRFQASASFQANLAIINQLRQIETTNGSKEFAELADGKLLGRAINENSNMDGSINPAATADNFALAYGQWEQFVIVDRIGSRIELIPNLVGANRRPTGQRGALLWFRTGSDVLVDNAFRLLNVATTA